MIAEKNSIQMYKKIQKWYKFRISCYFKPIVVKLKKFRGENCVLVADIYNRTLRK